VQEKNDANFTRQEDPLTMTPRPDQPPARKRNRYHTAPLGKSPPRSSHSQTNGGTQNSERSRLFTIMLGSRDLVDPRPALEAAFAVWQRALAAATL